MEEKIEKSNKINKEAKLFVHSLDVKCPADLSSSSWICLTSREMCCSRSVFCCSSLWTRAWASVRAHISTDSCSCRTWTCKAQVGENKLIFFPLWLFALEANGTRMEFPFKAFGFSCFFFPALLESDLFSNAIGT